MNWLLKNVYQKRLIQGTPNNCDAYLLLAIYCREQHQEPVSITRVRELRNQIANEAAEDQSQRTRKQGKPNKIRQLKRKKRRAKT